MSDEIVTIEIRDNGPLRVTGAVRIVDQHGTEYPVEGDVAKLCRCGASSTKPFCDGEHSRIGFRAAAEATGQDA
jgi:CDGSH-type Zn-finger protein